MGGKMKIWLIIASSLVLVGCMIFGGVMAMFQWDFKKLLTVGYETNDYELKDDYKNISIVTKAADIVFVPSENQKTSVVCHEQKKMKHLVTINDGTLVIDVVDTRKWYEYIGINFDTPKITVYIPQGEYGTLSVKSNTGDVEIPKDLKFESIDVLVSTGDVTNYSSASNLIKIKTSTGDINVESIFAGAIDLSVSTGNVSASDIACKGDMIVNVSTGKSNMIDIKCQKIISSGSTGDISLKNTIAMGEFSIKRSTGDVKFDGCDAAEIFVETDTGNVRGSLLTDKVFITQTDTGRVNVPKTTNGGKCEINTDTGDVIIAIKD